MTGVCAWREMLVAVNQARATARTCGTRAMPVAPALRWNTQLETAARAHNTHMASTGCFSHDTNAISPPFPGCRDGTPCSRAVAAGYRYARIGENIAGGMQFSSVDAVVQAWLESAGHCANLMDAQMTELGADRLDSSTARLRILWTQVFGRPGTSVTCP